mmetsp:Transcript_12097/g.35003  ORF Transcript_12097/g.35003 Transcript_12097/m.35003 type:complete len:96 (-) Transcript_12097:1120-1407(-)
MIDWMDEEASEFSCFFVCTHTGGRSGDRCKANRVAGGCAPPLSSPKLSTRRSLNRRGPIFRGEDDARENGLCESNQEKDHKPRPHMHGQRDKPGN